MEIFNQKKEIYSILITNLILSIFSFIGSLALILLYILRANLRKFTVFRLVFFLSLSENLASIGNFLSINKLYDNRIYSMNDNNAYCWIQSIILNYTDMCSLFWISAISYSIYQYLMNDNSFSLAGKKLYIILGFNIPIIYTVFTVIVNYYAKKYDSQVMLVWCWINAHDMAIISSVYAFYWIIIIYNTFIIFKVILYFKKKLKNTSERLAGSNLLIEKRKNIKRLIRRLYLYPLISILCWSFSTTQKLFSGYLNIQGTSDLEYLKRFEIMLLVLKCIFESMRGFLFSVVYGYDNEVKNEIKLIYYEYFKSEKPKNEQILRIS